MDGRVDNRRMTMREQPSGRIADLRRRAQRRTPGRTQTSLAQVLAPFSLGLAGILVLVLDGHGISWLAGLLAGGGGSAWLVLRGRTTAQGVPHLPSAARAERQTESTVKALEDSGWRFLHNVRGSDGTYDHIAVGRGGVIVLQSMTPPGVVTMHSGEPFAERHHDPGAEPDLIRVRPRAVADATAFRSDIEHLTGRRLWVQAMVVFWSEFPAGCVTDGRCVYIHGSRLGAWLTRRPQQLDETQIDDVFESVALLAQTGRERSRQVAV
jgi:hypothetical protein